MLLRGRGFLHAWLASEEKSLCRGEKLVPHEPTGNVVEFFLTRHPFIVSSHSHIMARPTSQTQARRLSNVYLCMYNLLSALLRICILLSTTYLWTTGGNRAVWDKLNTTARWSETLTALEVLHAVAGLVRAPPATTALQVAGRNTIVWAITRNYPDVAADEGAYSCMLMAWNLADSVRYLYFAFQTGTASVPSALLWARYEAHTAMQALRNTNHCKDTICSSSFIPSAFYPKPALSTKSSNHPKLETLLTSICFGLDWLFMSLV